MSETNYKFSHPISEINYILNDLITLNKSISNERIMHYLRKDIDINTLNFENFRKFSTEKNFYDYVYIYSYLKGVKPNINTSTNEMVRVYYNSNKDLYNKKRTFDILYDIFTKLKILN